MEYRFHKRFASEANARFFNVLIDTEIAHIYMF
jgi:hypothetical protein